jgi:hypothetical protein
MRNGHRKNKKKERIQKQMKSLKNKMKQLPNPIASQRRTSLVHLGMIAKLNLKKIFHSNWCARCQKKSQYQSLVTSENMY